MRKRRVILAGVLTLIIIVAFMACWVWYVSVWLPKEVTHRFETIEADNAKLHGAPSYCTFGAAT